MSARPSIPWRLPRRSFARLPLQDFGLEWIRSASGARASARRWHRRRCLTRRSRRPPRASAADADSYRDLFAPLVSRPRAPFRRSSSGRCVGPSIRSCSPASVFERIRSAQGLADSTFDDRARRARCSPGARRTAILPFDRAATAAIGLVLLLGGTRARLAPSTRWLAKRSRAPSRAYFASLGGEIETGRSSRSLDDLPSAKVVLFDVTPRQLARDLRRSSFRRATAAVSRSIATGPASSSSTGRSMAPSPGKRERAARRGTVHLGGTFEEIAAAEAAVWRGSRTPSDPSCSSRSRAFSTTRAPGGQAHRLGLLPRAARLDARHDATSSRARSSASPPAFAIASSRAVDVDPRDFEAYNENYVGGDITGGVTDLGQLFTRPVARANPVHDARNERIYLCSSSTPPGAGVHGMCGYFAARTALRRVFGRKAS